MKSDYRYKEVMADLMTCLGMAPLDSQFDGTYVLGFSDGAALYFRHAKDGFIDVLAEVGKLNDHPAQAVMADLLALNRLVAYTPSILVGLDRRTGIVTVSARVDIARCGKNVLTNLVWDVLGRVSTARSLLAGGNGQRAANARYGHIGKQLILKAAEEAHAKRRPDACST